MFLTKGASHTTVQSLSMVAMAILKHNGDRKWQRSLSLLQEAIEMRQELGPTHPDMGLLHHGMGNVYRFRGNYPKAQEHYQQAADIRLAAYGIGPNFCTVESLDALADACLEQDKTEKALEVLKNCLKMRVKHVLETTEEHLIGDGPGLDCIRTTCEKIRGIYEARHDVSQAQIWQNASKSERLLSAIPQEYFPR